ncbi:PWWP domain-containing protein 2A isoform X2 [Trichomycterus rosablanca]|uniref:PWWP domain-containing protein 2A isoform X2 n=1 Tax=Trichomycterus rosablanca TaxID=2290929 RepID=UPI002F35F9F8
MAAVAAEPGAAAAGASTTAAGDGLVYAAEPGEHVADLEPEPTAVFAPEMEVCGQQAESADAAEECSQVQVEMSRPEVRVAGKPECVQTQDGPTDTDTATATADEHMLTDSTQTHTEAAEERLKEPFSFNQVSPHESGSSVRFLPPSTGSDPAAPAAEEPDTGLYLTEPTPEPSHDNLESVPELERDLLVSSPRSNSEPEAATIAPDSIFNPPVDAFHESSDPPESEVSLGESVAQSCTSDSSKDSEPAEPLTSSEPEDTHVHAHGSRLTDGLADTQISEQKVQQGCAEPADSQLEPIHGLVPGSEVRVSLDHIIDDALVVSFHLGEKIFSGVLMDVSKRFGPYGIPITVFPKREYKDKPESMQLKAEPFQSEKGIIQETPDVLSKDVAQGSSEAQANPKPEPNPWTSKPPPLFQEGAAYPPPLFIRDTYSQSLPQPPPRKIKRPKRRLYREEPTSIMNAIKLRPRQVLCDKCKEAVVQGDKRETRRGPISDCQRDDAKRRRNNSAATTAGKRPRSDARSEDRSRSVDAPKRQTAAIRVTSSSTSTALGQVKGAAAGNRIIKGVSSTALSSANSSSRVQLNAKKVLQSKNVDHSKAREVLKMAKAQKRQRETVGGSSGNNKGRTRATALQEAHQKVHHTRRLQQISVGGPTLSNPLPPRMRIKPQRSENAVKPLEKKYNGKYCVHVF